jgi:hypothetical protein
MTLAETSFNPLANAVIQRKRDLMRMCLLFIGIAGSAVLASGQTGPSQGGGTSISPPWQQMTAHRIERADSGTWMLRGSVRIVQGTAVITADEVDGRIAPNGALEYDLRGNVHVTMNPEQ